MIIEEFVNEDKHPNTVINDFESIFSQVNNPPTISYNNEVLTDFDYENTFSFRPKQDSKEDHSPDKSMTKSMISGTEDKITNFSGSDDILINIESARKIEKNSPGRSEQSIQDEDHNNVSTLDICLQGYSVIYQDKQFMTDLSKCIVAPKYQVTYQQPMESSTKDEEIKDHTLNHSRLNISKRHGREPTMDLNSDSNSAKLPLFEELELIGINRKDLEETAALNPKERKLTVKPRLLYSFPGDACDNSAKRILPEFAFPFDVPAYKIPNSASKINK